MNIMFFLACCFVLLCVFANYFFLHVQVDENSLRLLFVLLGAWEVMCHGVFLLLQCGVMSEKDLFYFVFYIPIICLLLL